MPKRAISICAGKGGSSGAPLTKCFSGTAICFVLPGSASSGDGRPFELSEAKAADKGGKFLTFFLAGEEYGIEILKVHEIIGMMPITMVPHTPAYLKGVINLRGKVISVVDLREKFEMDYKEKTAETCIIVVQTGGAEKGIIVDKVSEVLADTETRSSESVGAES